MGKIVAIGGGEIGRPGYPVETRAIDKEIIRLTGKKHPKLLFLPTASNDNLLYVKVVKEHFGKRLGCRIDVLFLIREDLKKKEIQSQIRKKVLSSDIIYVGGGNTLRMMKVWRRSGLDSLLKDAYTQGKVLCGVSAGAVCWFRYGCSDSWKMKNPKAPYIKVKGLGLFNTILCPHYDKEKGRKAGLKAMMKKTYGVAIAVDNCAAIEIVDKKYRIINSKKRAKAYKVYWKNNRFFSISLKKSSGFFPIEGFVV